MHKSKPILIVAGEPFSVFLEIFFKSKKIKSIKKKDCSNSIQKTTFVSNEEVKI